MKKHTYNYFDSLDSFIKEINKTPRKKRDSSEKHEDDEWSGSAASVKEAVELPIKGYEVEIIEAEVGQIHTAAHKNLEPIFTVSGGDVEMGRYMSGDPECMLDFDMADSKTRFAHIIIGITESARTGNYQILNRIAALSSIVDDLENQRYRVKISAAIGNDDFGKTGGNLTVVDLKDYWQHMPIASLSGFLHTSFYRRGIFCYWEGHKNWEKPNGYGSPIDLTTMGLYLAENDKTLDVDHMVYLPSISESHISGSGSEIPKSEFKSIEDARDYTTEIVKHIDGLSS